MIKAYAVHEAKGELKSFEYDPGLLGEEEIEIKVEYCGICHSDLSMLNNEWGTTQYPLVPGHEVVGTIGAVGNRVKTVSVGQKVGLGWFSRSCLTCEWCMGGDQNLCQTAESTIVGRHGGFADKVRAHYSWVFPLPPEINLETAGPLFCGGITVFNPIVECGIKSTDRVGVIGIGGLGHMAIQFLHAWGCDVTAFSSSSDKEEEAKQLGANHFVNSRNENALKEVENSFDFILSTVNADLDWNGYINALRPKGRLHFVGVTPNPLSVQIFPLILGQKTVSASPLGSPTTIAQMLDFATRHKIEPIIEIFPLDKVNEAIAKLENGQPRYRLVLKV
ncbi:NADPH-dependent aldehyde reductase Ahr [Crocosphaera sp. XPORK-15E]|uniref:NADPH-dependent aldehyde reductase Ahr n=1 Tax=Crocosphaera sp. XPORK-15E TaxID=3110247 RepID=UPI002B201A00|nr:NAD(P)-dependent alcohol dehydrogenase [Crocosphaera sp. XPORK-15E]MEA5535693.1 NAD(P)-dependent alcohol dehydrogenase [Crocosphaera sp. XPORK-15E]